MTKAQTSDKRMMSKGQVGECRRVANRGVNDGPDNPMYLTGLRMLPMLGHIDALAEQLEKAEEDSLAGHLARDERAIAQAEQLAAANDTLARLRDYGIHTRNFGDGDASALWDRIDEFRGDEDATLSLDDVRALAEWWTELHESLCDLDEKFVAANEAREKLKAGRDALAEASRDAVGLLALNPGFPTMKGPDSLVEKYVAAHDIEKEVAYELSTARIGRWQALKRACRKHVRARLFAALGEEETPCF